MKKRILSMLLSLTLCVSLIGVAGVGAEAFSDISEEAMTEAAEVLSGLGIITGFTDGSYRPNESLTRAQFCALAVRTGGYSDELKLSAYRTLYTDVKATYWAAPYVNLAQDKGIINGYGNGQFGPDDAVTVAQAVTVALRLLGYTSDDIGPFWPEDYIQLGEDLGLTEDIDASSNDALTRGQAALLFYHVLMADTADGDDYVSNLAASSISGAVILDNDAESDDGITGLLSIYAPGADISTYEQSTTISDAMVNRRGTILINSSGIVTGFVPDDKAWRALSIGSVTAAKITSSGGVAYAVPSGAVLVIDDNVTTYANGWYDLDGRDSVNIFYSSGGTVNLVVASESQEYDGVMLTGYYEAVSPNTDNPTSITLLGTEFSVESVAVSSLSQFDVGDRITVTLNGNGDVISAISASTKTSNLVGVVKKLSGTSCTVELFSGITVSGTISSSSSDIVGDLVRVTSSGIGKISVSTSVTSSVTGTLDVSGAKLGSVPLSGRVVIYDRVGKGIPVEVELEDILTSTVNSSNILYAATDSSGEINVLVLDDVTGNAYTYGILHTSSTTDKTADLNATNRTVAVENSDGTTDYYIYSSSSISDQTIGGISISSAERVTGAIALEKEKSVARASFNGTDSVVIDKVAVPISDDVQVYNDTNNTWMTLAAAKSYASSFTVYYSGEIGGDAVVRVIVTE